MSDRGRHARSSGPGFYRDVLLLVAGILIVGALVFGGLSLWAGRTGDDEPTPPAVSPTLTRAETTTTTAPSTAPSITSTTAASTTSGATTSSVTTTPTTTREARDPSEVRAIVLNSIGVTGLAGSLSDELAGLGYQVAEADNYTPELSDTMIFHADGFALEAVELAEAVPDATVAPDPELASSWGVDVVVVIGRSYQE
ncbi:MAG TPA: LytR C-terminal domain-containing protein [Acidimicrobiia bacterium]|nr:LytR C-terminal domain-containing protein [Acidimicrobiia bacterium]